MLTMTVQYVVSRENVYQGHIFHIPAESCIAEVDCIEKDVASTIRLWTPGLKLRAELFVCHYLGVDAHSYSHD